MAGFAVVDLALLAAGAGFFAVLLAAVGFDFDPADDFAAAPLDGAFLAARVASTLALVFATDLAGAAFFAGALVVAVFGALFFAAVFGAAFAAAFDADFAGADFFADALAKVGFATAFFAGALASSGFGAAAAFFVAVDFFSAAGFARSSPGFSGFGAGRGAAFASAGFGPVSVFAAAFFPVRSTFGAADFDSVFSFAGLRPVTARSVSFTRSASLASSS
ncbi:MAG TPA: hypothetical protein VHV51_04660 [Polyangiaceae bacterium]|nr:hypothetical protein [Polyangiaceae bacterium]